MIPSGLQRHHPLGCGKWPELLHKEVFPADAQWSRRAAQRGSSIALCIAGACLPSDAFGLAAGGGLGPIAGHSCSQEGASEGQCQERPTGC